MGSGKEGSQREGWVWGGLWWEEPAAGGEGVLRAKAQPRPRPLSTWQIR